VQKGLFSSRYSTVCGVPQGCILSPLLFLIFINDLPSFISKRTIPLLFADDLSIVPLANGLPSHNDLDIALRGCTHWAKLNRMRFGIKPDKSAFMVFSRCHRPPIPSLFLSNQPLPLAPSYTFLGLTLTPKLNWSMHFSRIHQKTARLSFLISKLLHSQFPPSLRTIRTFSIAFLRSACSYALCLWRPSSSHLHTLHRELVKPLRCALRLHRSAGFHNILVDFGLPSLSMFRHQQLLSFYSTFDQLPDDHPIIQIFDDYIHFSPSRSRTAFSIASEIHEALEAVGSSVGDPPQRSSLPGIILQHDFDQWSSSPHSLSNFKHRPGLSYYLSHDSIIFAQLRARFRLNVAPIGGSKISSSPRCPLCSAEVEDIFHVIMTCPAYDAARYRLFCHFSYYRITPTLQIILGDFDSIPSHLRSTIISITGEFLLSISRIRKLL